jgi:addiction module RelE/StbE family toxin
MRLRWTERARADLLAIIAHISEQRPAAARKMAAHIHASMIATLDHPLIGRVVPELDVADIRERLVPPYRVIYQLRGDPLLVLAVVPSRRGSFTGAENDDDETG